VTTIFKTEIRQKPCIAYPMAGSIHGLFSPIVRPKRGIPMGPMKLEMEKRPRELNL
jgi:hypothetical protein